MASKSKRKKNTSSLSKAQNDIQEELLDFYSRCITESIFYLTPYILLFIVLGFIFN